MNQPQSKYKLFRNKYFLVIAFFLVWMSFFDPKDWGTIIERIGKLNRLEKSEKLLRSQIEDTKSELHMLKSGAQSIERYARENYLMKKDNEEIFVVKTP